MNDNKCKSSNSELKQIEKYLAQKNELKTKKRENQDDFSITQRVC